MYCRVMCIAVLIILREPVGYRSQQQWGIYQSTWSYSARYVHFAYLSNTAGSYSPLIYKTTRMHDYAKPKYGFLHFTGYLHMLALRFPVLPGFVLPW